MLLLFLLPVPAMTGLKPSRMSCLPVEVKAAVSAHAAVMCAGANEGRLRGPCEGTLFDGKDGKLGNDLVNREQTSEQPGGRRLHLTIRRCMSILHDGIGESRQQPRADACYL